MPGGNFRQLHTEEVIFLHGCDVLHLDKKRTISFLPHSFYGREKNSSLLSMTLLHMQYIISHFRMNDKTPLSSPVKRFFPPGHPEGTILFSLLPG